MRYLRNKGFGAIQRFAQELRPEGKKGREVEISVSYRGIDPATLEKVGSGQDGFSGTMGRYSTRQDHNSYSDRRKTISPVYFDCLEPVGRVNVAWLGGERAIGGP